MYREEVFKPFEVTNTLGLFDVVANVHGGGVSGQASVRTTSPQLDCIPVRYCPAHINTLRLAGIGRTSYALTVPPRLLGQTIMDKAKRVGKAY